MLDRRNNLSLKTFLLKIKPSFKFWQWLTWCFSWIINGFVYIFFLNLELRKYLSAYLPLGSTGDEHTSKITLVLQLLSDGDWHKIEELKRAIGFDEYEIVELMGFLGKYGFATVDNTRVRVKVNPDFQKLLIQKGNESAF